MSAPSTTHLSPLPSTMFAFRHQPLKTFYLLFALVTVPFIRLPYWVVLSSISAFRPKTTWSMRRTLMFWVVKASTKMFYSIGFPAPQGNPDVDSAHPEETGFMWVDAVPSSLVTGEIEEMARKNAVSPARVYGYWYGTRDATGKHGQRAGIGERVFYFLHGTPHLCRVLE